MDECHLTDRELAVWLKRRIQADEIHRKATGIGMDSTMTIDAFRLALDVLLTRIEAEKKE